MVQLRKLIKKAISNRSKTKAISLKKIVGTIILCSICGIAAAQNHVSNIRIEQRGELLHVTYDLEERADIEVFVSFDGGTTYRNRPLQRISGAVGKSVEPGKDKLLVWDMVREIGYLDLSKIVIRISSDALISTENVASADISLKHPYNHKILVGVVGGFSGMGFVYPEDYVLSFGLNVAYFVNRKIGVGFALQNFASIKWNIMSRYVFFGPLFYGHMLQTRNGKFIFPISVGIGGVYRYIYDNGKSFIIKDDDILTKTSPGFFISGGFAYRPLNFISAGINCEWGNMYDSKTIFSYGIYPSITLGLNFYF